MKPPVWLGNPYQEVQENLTIADILAVNSGSSATNGSITLTLGNATTGEVYTQNAILFNGAGLYSVPLPSGTIASNGTFTASQISLQGAQAVCWVRNDQWIALSVRDTRAQTNPGNIQAGELALQVPGAAGRVILKQDGSVNLYTLNGGNSMGVFVSPGDNALQAVNSNGYGLNIADSSVSISASTSAPQGGSLVIEDSGAVNLTGTKQTQIDGANIVLGSQVVAELNTAVINPNAIVETLTTISDALTLITTAMSSFTGTGSFSALPAAVAGIDLAVSSISSLTTLISSTKVSIQ